MVELRIEQIEFVKQGYKVYWSVDDHKHLYQLSPLEISYEFMPSCDLFVALNNFLAFTLPILAKEYGSVRVISDFEWDKRIKGYWERLLRALRIESFHIDWVTNSDKQMLNSHFLGQTMSQGRIGLLYGGGVESNFALSILYPYKPVLISIVGEQWMNNDIRRYGIKKQLEDALVDDWGVELQRVYSNALSLVNRPDTYKNYYITGILFYWHSLPVCQQFGILTLYKSSEMEEALNFDYQDLSLHPSFLKNIMIEGGPLYLPLFNCYPKIQMLEELSHTPFIKYIYSCFHNTGKRWCGECSKCYRISEFCERLGIDRSVIGMQEGIVGLRETGSISRHYWRLADQLYGKRRRHELVQALKYYRKRAKWLIKQALRHFGPKDKESSACR
jgi:hypothetical protein